MHGQAVTACGLAIVGAYLSRDWQLDNLLCPVCFTPRERDTGEMQKLERESLDQADAIAYGDSHDDDTAVERSSPTPTTPPEIKKD
jgi:hypothetical protein